MKTVPCCVFLMSLFGFAGSWLGHLLTPSPQPQGPVASQFCEAQASATRVMLADVFTEQGKRMGRKYYVKSSAKILSATESNDKKLIGCSFVITSSTTDLTQE